MYVVLLFEDEEREKFPDFLYVYDKLHGGTGILSGCWLAQQSVVTLTGNDELSWLLFYSWHGLAKASKREED